MNTRPWLDLQPAGEHLPTMMSREELQLLRHLTRTAVRGGGAVLEIGPWLGASTYALAQGLSENDDRGSSRVISVDSYVWHRFMGDRAPLDLPEGASFEPAFREHLAPFGDLVEPMRARLPDDDIRDDPQYTAIREHTGDDIPLFAWPDDAPIALLFVDGAKSWRGLRDLYRQCLPQMAPGSVLVLQDYRYWGCYWVPVMTEWFADALELRWIPSVNSIGFVVRRPIDAARAASVPALDQLDTGTARAHVSVAAERLRAAGDEAGAAIVELSLAPLLWHRGDRAGAHAAFDAAERTWPRRAAREQLERARTWLFDVSGHRPAPGLRLRALRAAERIERRARALRGGGR